MRPWFKKLKWQPRWAYCETHWEKGVWMRKEGETDNRIVSCAGVAFVSGKIFIQCWRDYQPERIPSPVNFYLKKFHVSEENLNSHFRALLENFLHSLTLVDNRLPYWGVLVLSKYVYRQFVKFSIRNDVRESILTRPYSEDSICSVLYSVT